ncbi:NADH-ubiquinone oxidoreductase-F iron-sulfur binding region domain-containing protein [Candidatus Pelagibacter sp. HIMB1321]|uniref:NADH-ubiquinone oxidoreductase-F iron-sulfur binding region domain-containing protein n=1 Tax=Candidatus Pelagibacter sp. HIMB1321 TaxID=1388755 RepID=UPI000A07E255|nr:NADH-ubiquinone oxidoreductase-F iron-sulfur binding region domain-containing protein [Candidatus Pelagibacter sp. HIMB1321]SMF71762.1 NADH-quinone oxidoreductase subunit F [Candidatus Pelagibacter sp. HIMB1321]
MSKNISNLSGRIGLKDNLFQKISENSLSKSPKDIKEIAKEYNLGVSTLHGAESFYEFLRPSHREKKAFVCNGSACMCAGTQDKLKETLKSKLGDDKVGEMFCLGHCYENKAFHYDGENYAGNDIEKIDQIIKGEKIDQDKYFSKSFASTSFLMDDKLSTIEKFKDQLGIILKKDKKEIIQSLLDSNLTGRGGAGFPTGMKWDFCSKAPGDKKYVICNADEGDSGAFSDRYLLEDQPLKVIFGMVVCGYVIGSNEGVLYIRGEYPKSIEAINGCINLLKEEGLLGENILGTNFKFDLNICIGQGAYICGEETALIASIEGRRAEVDVRPPFPVTEGLYKKPTVVNNVETLAAASGILLNGAEKFAAIGNKKSAGTKLVCLDSFFNNPGIYEIEMGTPMKKIFEEIGGGYKEPVKAFQIGGPLGGVVPLSEIENLNLDFQEFTAKGFMLGHASVVSIPKDFPMTEYIHHLFEFSAEESCGKCFPGRLGSYRGKEMFDQFKSKTAKIPLKLLNELLVTMQKGCLCALCGAIPTPIMNILKYFGDEMKNDMVKDN